MKSARFMLAEVETMASLVKQELRKIPDTEETERYRDMLLEVYGLLRTLMGPQETADGPKYVIEV